MGDPFDNQSLERFCGELPVACHDTDLETYIKQQGDDLNARHLMATFKDDEEANVYLNFPKVEGFSRSKPVVPSWRIGGFGLSLHGMKLQDSQHCKQEHDECGTHQWGPVRDFAISSRRCEGMALLAAMAINTPLHIMTDSKAALMRLNGIIQHRSSIYDATNVALKSMNFLSGGVSLLYCDRTSRKPWAQQRDGDL